MGTLLGFGLKILARTPIPKLVGEALQWDMGNMVNEHLFQGNRGGKYNF